MEISGKIIAALPIATGQGKNGIWRSQDYVLETLEQYSKKVCFNLFGDKIDQYPMNMGDEVNVSFDIDSREYNGRWYTTVKAWKVDKTTSVPATTSPDPYYAPAQAAAPAAGTGEDSDLPF